MLPQPGAHWPYYFSPIHIKGSRLWNTATRGWGGGGKPTHYVSVLSFSKALTLPSVSQEGTNDIISVVYKI